MAFSVMVSLAVFDRGGGGLCWVTDRGLEIKTIYSHLSDDLMLLVD